MKTERRELIESEIRLVPHPTNPMKDWDGQLLVRFNAGFWLAAIGLISSYVLAWLSGFDLAEAASISSLTLVLLLFVIGAVCATSLFSVVIIGDWSRGYG